VESEIAVTQEKGQIRNAAFIQVNGARIAAIELNRDDVVEVFESVIRLHAVGARAGIGSFAGQVNALVVWREHGAAVRPSARSEVQVVGSFGSAAIDRDAKRIAPGQRFAFVSALGRHQKARIDGFAVSTDIGDAHVPAHVIHPVLPRFERQSAFERELCSCMIGSQVSEVAPSVGAAERVAQEVDRGSKCAVGGVDLAQHDIRAVAQTVVGADGVIGERPEYPGGFDISEVRVCRRRAAVGAAACFFRLDPVQGRLVYGIRRSRYDAPSVEHASRARRRPHLCEQSAMRWVVEGNLR